MFHFPHSSQSDFFLKHKLDYVHSSAQILQCLLFVLGKSPKSIKRSYQEKIPYLPNISLETSLLLHITVFFSSHNNTTTSTMSLCKYNSPTEGQEPVLILQGPEKCMIWLLSFSFTSSLFSLSLSTTFQPQQPLLNSWKTSSNCPSQDLHTYHTPLEILLGITLWNRNSV